MACLTSSSQLQVMKWMGSTGGDGIHLGESLPVLTFYILGQGPSEGGEWPSGADGDWPSGADGDWPSGADGDWPSGGDGHWPSGSGRP